MSLSYPHYIVELAIALAVLLSILFGFVAIWIVAVKLRVICRVFGHDWDYMTLEYRGVYECMRCDHHGYEDRSVRRWLIERRLKAWQWLRARRAALRPRLIAIRERIRCSECGARFGRHVVMKGKHIRF